MLTDDLIPTRFTYTPPEPRTSKSVENPTLQLKLYERIIKEGLSVRKVEELAKSMREEKPEKPQREDSTHDFDLLKNHLTAKIQNPCGFCL